MTNESSTDLQDLKVGIVKMETRITNMENKMETRITNMENKMDDRITNMENKITNIDTGLRDDLTFIKKLLIKIEKKQLNGTLFVHCQ